MRLSFVAATLSSAVLVSIWVAPQTEAASCEPLTPYGAPAAQGSERNTVRVCEQSPDQSIAFFTTDYDRSEAAPRWVAYKLTRQEMLDVAKSGIKRGEDAVPFAADSGIETTAFRSPTDKDYTGIGKAGYDRGHYLPADAMKWSLDAYHSTFVVSNITLQASSFNEHLWQEVEDQERGWACDHKTIYSVTGVIFRAGGKSFQSKTHKAMKFMIPTHYWKVVYTPDDGGHTIGIIYPNVSTKADVSAAGVRSLMDMEQLTGLTFMPKLTGPKRHKLDAEQPDLKFWKLDYPSQFACK